MDSKFEIALEQKLAEMHLASLVISRDNKIGTPNGTRVGELIEQFESQTKLCQLMHLHFGKTTGKIDQQAKKKMV